MAHDLTLSCHIEFIKADVGGCREQTKGLAVAVALCWLWRWRKRIVFQGVYANGQCDNQRAD